MGISGEDLTCKQKGQALGLLVSDLFNYKSPARDPLKAVNKYDNQINSRKIDDANWI